MPTRLFIWLAIGDRVSPVYTFLGLTVALVLATKYLPAAVAQPLAAVCDPLGRVVWRLAGGLFLLGPGALAYMFSGFVVERFPRSLQVVTLLVWLVFLAFVSVLLYSRALRERVRLWLDRNPSKFLGAFSWRERVETWAAIALYIDFVIIAMGCFAGVAYLLHGLTPPLFLPKARPVGHGSLADFLLWHLLDAIPGLKVPETIKWEAPLSYERAGAGWLLLLFKIMVIVPVVSGIGHYLKDEDDEKSASELSAGSLAPRGSVRPSD